MAGCDIGARRSVGWVETAGVLRSKLRPPHPFRPLVRRTALRQRLDDAVAGAGVVLLLGPAGIGKTSLLAEWSAERDVSWVTIDAADNDPVRFWSHVAAALDTTPAREVPAGSDLYVERLADGVSGTAVLVLDEYEHLTEPRVHQQLDQLVRGGAGRLTVLVASRVRPPLPLRSLVLAGGVAELGWPELRVTSEEAPLFGVPAEMVRLTDGWAGGLALLASRDPADLPAGREALADYLTDTVLSGLEPEIREFLLDTAVLERFSVPLAAAVHPAADAAVVLDRLRLDGTFLLREADGWFRYQRLFRWALIRRLHALDPARERAAHRAAAEWYDAQGSTEDAVGHALSAGDTALAVRLVTESFDDLTRSGRLVTLERWLGLLPDADVAAIDGALADRVLDLWCSLGRSDQRDRWQRLTGRRPRPDGPARAADVWQLCLPRERGDLAAAIRQSRTVLARTDADWTSPLTATQARISAARSLLLAGRPDECRQVLAGLESRWTAGRLPAALAMAVHALRGLAAYRDGDPETARTELGRADRAHDLATGPVRPAAAPEHLILRAALAGRPDDVRRLQTLVDDELDSDHTMATLGNLVLAAVSPDTENRLARADALLAGFPSALGLVDLREEIAGSGGPDQLPDQLSERERMVLQYLRSDLTLADIAAHLYVSVNTVKTHARHIYRKLGVTGRRDLTR